MEISKTLEEAIENQNLVGIKSAFYTILHEDPGFWTGKFDRTLQYVRSKNISGLMQAYDGETFEPEEAWDSNYWALVASELVDNFCEERIEHLRQVGAKVYPQKTVEKEVVNRDVMRNKVTVSGYEKRKKDARKKAIDRQKAKNMSFFEKILAFLFH